MKTQSTNRILLLANEFSSAHGLREVTSRAGLSLDLEQVASREEFYSSVSKCAPALVLVNLAGVVTLPMSEVVHYALTLDPPVNVVIIGEESASSASGQEAIRQGALAYVPANELERLPVILDRVMRDRETGAVRDRLEREGERAAQILRENQKLITIGKLTASIAHEINNPLESITNLLYLLNAEPNMPEGAGAYLALAQRELERVVQITRQTLTFYRETPVAIRIQPADLLEEVLVLYARKIQEKQLEVVREYHSDEPVTVFPGEIRQVFSNIITNAIEASSRGGKLRLRVRRARNWFDQGIMGLRISIADSGCGIDSDVRHRLGQLFFTTKGDRGTGLGLWVTDAIVRRYGGSVQIYSSTSARHHGTVFSVFLPTNMRPQRVLPSGSLGSSFSSGYAGFADLSMAEHATPTSIERSGNSRDRLHASGY